MRRASRILSPGGACGLAATIGFLFAQAAPMPDGVALEAYKKTGKFGEAWGEGIPLAMTPAAMERGRSRYVAYCAVCHGADGAFSGGTTNIASLTSPRTRALSDGETFNIISNGRTNMVGFSGALTESDRWKVVAYVRALQRSQTTTPPQSMPEAMAAEVDVLSRKVPVPAMSNVKGQNSAK